MLTVILGWPDWMTTLIMGGLAVAYTTTGGAKAIAWSDLQQMVVMTLGLAAALICAVCCCLPATSRSATPFNLAGAAGRLNVITTTFDWNDRYNLWSGLIGGAFLALAYFGTDQIAGAALPHRPVDRARAAAACSSTPSPKIPMQFFILFIGAHGLRVLHLSRSRRCCSSKLEHARIESPGRRDATRPSSSATTTAFDARQHAADGLLGAARGRRAPARRSDAPRTCAGATAISTPRAGTRPRWPSGRRQRRERHELHLPDVRDAAPAGRAGRSGPRGDLRRDDDVDFGRDERTRDRQRGRHLQAPRPDRGDPTTTT